MTLLEIKAIMNKPWAFWNYAAWFISSSQAPAGRKCFCIYDYFQSTMIIHLLSYSLFIFISDNPTYHLLRSHRLYEVAWTPLSMGRHTGHYCKPIFYVLNNSMIASLSYKHAKLQINIVYLLI